MKMKVKKATRWFTVAVLFVVLLSGCSLWGGDRETKQIDPPPAGANLGMGDGEAVPVVAGEASEVEQQMEVTLFYKDPHGFVVPVSVDVPLDVAKAKKTLEYMVDGGPGAALVPPGFQALIPQGTIINGISVVKDNLAIVDFSDHFASYNPQDERKILEAITWALTQYETIDKVELRLNGHLMDEMPQEGTPLHEPLSRVMGINLERGEGVDLIHSTAVTLYFQGQLEDGETYFVPVTRFIGRSDHIALATLQALIDGPIRTGLASVSLPTAKVLRVEQTDETLSVDFDSSILNQDNKAPHALLQSVVLSLTETTAAEQVQIKVDGSVQVLSTDDMNYNKPVVRPEHVNKLKL